MQETDQNHRLTMPQIIKKLEDLGIKAERKSIYSDMDNLRDFGFDIIGEQNGNAYDYFIGSREFETPELKLLVDAVQSSRFITEKKSEELIKKLEAMVSKHEASSLQRQVFVSGRIKSMNESIFYNVDNIHEAIAENRRIKFQYLTWSIDKKLVPKRNGQVYEISPWSLIWDNENYYLVGFDSTERKIKHFRVDKMQHIEITSIRREGESQFSKLDMAVYAQTMFGMFGGEEKRVTLECTNQFAGVILDRFGTDLIFTKVDDEHFTVNVKVAFSNQFIGWVIGLGEDVRIIGPESALAEVKEVVKRLNRQYKR